MILTHMQIAAGLALILGYAAAHAAGLLTHINAPAWVLGLVTTILATVAGVVPTVVWNQSDTWQTYAGHVFLALFAATMAHRSKIPTRLQAATPRLGFGAPTFHRARR